MNGDVVVIASGDYVGDVARWGQSNLTLCGSGGRARLFANGQNAAGKGIWVISGANVTVDSIEFHGATVPDQNGAGIRAEGNGLTIINAGFFDNENGMLGPDAGDLTIVRSEFARNGVADPAKVDGYGRTHNIYVGGANKVTISASHFHEARIGHNFKSRARQTTIDNSYFMDGTTGSASYLVDVPDGGVVVLRGNLFQKGPNADNSISVHYGEEYLAHGWPVNTLTLVHNTFVSTRSGGVFVSADGGVSSVVATANLFAGTGGTTAFSVPAGRLTQTHSLATVSTKIVAPDNVQSPSFWPNDPALLNQMLLGSIVDAGYAVDSPLPRTLRAIAGNARYVGALQSAP